MGSHAAFLARPAGARTNDKVVFVIEDWSEQARDRFRPVAAVAVEKHDDFSFPRNRCRIARSTGAAITAPLFDEHPRSGSSSLCHRPVAAAAVDNDDVVNP